MILKTPIWGKNEGGEGSDIFWVKELGMDFE